MTRRVVARSSGSMPGCSGCCSSVTGDEDTGRSVMTMAGWWAERVVQRVVDLTCSGALADSWRARTCGPMVGEVLELGFGPGRNLEHYAKGVTGVLAVDPFDLASGRRSWRRDLQPLPRARRG